MDEFTRAVVGDVCDDVGETLCNLSFYRERSSWTFCKSNNLLDVLFACVLLVLGLHGQISKDLDILLVDTPVGTDALLELKELLLELLFKIVCCLVPDLVFDRVFESYEHFVNLLHRTTLYFLVLLGHHQQAVGVDDVKLCLLKLFLAD